MKAIEQCERCAGKGTVYGAYDFEGQCVVCKGEGHTFYDTEERFESNLVAFLDSVKAEVMRARHLFPGRRIMGLALAEEFGELMKALLDEHSTSVKKEAIQTACMCVRVALEGDESVDEWRAKKGLDKLGSQ